MASVAFQGDVFAGQAGADELLDLFGDKVQARALARRCGVPVTEGSVGAVDPASIGAAIIVLAISAVIAVLVPAVRASRVSPIVALRAE